jgi:chromate reductase, NAD(P)H dehydrogenase (quinone)
VILAISGSLRRDSLNSAALRAAARAAARTRLRVELDDSPHSLPQFNPDLEAQPPEAVQRFRVACEDAGAVLLAVPEYAFGIPGTFKNALDWTVGSGAIYRKPVAVLSVAPEGRAAHVRRALELVFTALDCDVSWHHVPIHPSLLQRGEIRTESIIDDLLRVVDALARRTQTTLSECSARDSNL